MSVGWKVITSAATVPVATSTKMEGLTATKKTKHEKNSGTTVIEESYGHEAIPDGSNGPTDLKTTNPPTSMAYPNCDLNIWLRSCEIEVINPLEGITTGAIPLWEACTEMGPESKTMVAKESTIFSTLLGFCINLTSANGKVTYQSRYVNSTSYVLNTVAGQLVVPEFTTPAAPDPCKSIFHRISSLFVLDQVVSDNAMISIYPMAKDLYAFAETPFIHRIDPVTMETTRRESLHETLSVFNQSSHPHITESGEAYQLGQKIGAKGPSYDVIHYPEEKFK
ncbi:carotenoid isomerooxygenase-like [Daphnia pulicaria]|uniref:carotenoid isomerooxygenase-like n=1 Tax=Daphnia pulicaria TaxID=35523 RepID=UPI001EE9B001|nr:carotenoid isomerooxygenase-like [Daphnia pulicaria]